MSARIVVTLAHGLALSAIDRDADGGVWLSLWRTEEVVVTKLSMPSAQALWLALSKELGMLSGQSPALGNGTGCDAGTGGPSATGADPAGDIAECATATTSTQPLPSVDI